MVTLQSLVSLKSFDSYFTRKKRPTRAIFWFYLFPSRAFFGPLFFFLRKWRLSVGLLPGKNGNSRAVLHTMWHALSNLQASRVDIGEFFCRNCWWLKGADGWWPMILFVAWNLRFAAGLWLVFVAMSLEMLVWRWTRKWSTRKAVYLCMQCMFSLQLSAGEGFTSRHISLGWLHTDDSISSAQLWNRCQLLNQPKGLLNLWTMGACQPTDTDQFKNSCGFFNLRQLLADYWYSQDHISCCLRMLCHSNLTPLCQRSRDPSFRFVAYELILSASLEGEKTKIRKSGFSSKLWEVLEWKMFPAYDWHHCVWAWVDAGCGVIFWKVWNRFEGCSKLDKLQAREWGSIVLSRGDYKAWFEASFFPAY